jgi:single-strand DNA-binding protein
MLTMTVHGRLGRDAELRDANGTSVADLAIACNYGRKGEDGKKPTQWVRASLWGKQAEAMLDYLTKGKGLVAILSDVHVRSYNKNDGTPATSLEGRVDQIAFTGAGPSEAAKPAAPPPPPPKPKPKAAGDDFDDDDIPF